MKNNHRAGHKAVTINDLALVLGVSNATVSRALSDSPLINERTALRIKAKAKEMGYVPDNIAKMMRGEASNLVGFILPDVQNHFYSAMAKALAENVSSLGLQLVLAISEDDPEIELRHVRELRRARARGIIITPVASMEAETAELLSAMKTVQLVRSHPQVKSDVVAAQDFEAIRLSTEHLLSQGHRNIGYLGGGPEILDSGQRRLDGFRKSVTRFSDVEITEKLAAPHPEEGYQATMEIMSKPSPPTALVIGSPQLTLGALRAIRELRLRVPQDIALVSYDDPDWLQLCEPAISTVALPIIDMANFATKLIDDRYSLKGGPTPDEQITGNKKRYSFPVSLIPRESSTSQPVMTSPV